MYVPKKLIGWRSNDQPHTTYVRNPNNVAFTTINGGRQIIVYTSKAELNLDIRLNAWAINSPPIMLGVMNDGESDIWQNT